jgi:hypothetical protein
VSPVPESAAVGAVANELFTVSVDERAPSSVGAKATLIVQLVAFASDARQLLLEFTKSVGLLPAKVMAMPVIVLPLLFVSVNG